MDENKMTVVILAIVLMSVILGVLFIQSESNLMGGAVLLEEEKEDTLKALEVDYLSSRSQHDITSISPQGLHSDRLVDGIRFLTTVQAHNIVLERSGGDFARTTILPTQIRTNSVQTDEICLGNRCYTDFTYTCKEARVVDATVFCDDDYLLFDVIGQCSDGFAPMVIEQEPQGYIKHAQTVSCNAYERNAQLIGLSGVCCR
ncbi:MAG: hypothetical protein ACMXYC_02865 [Candidatus Woesearchaeota archaeon]